MKEEEEVDGYMTRQIDLALHCCEFAVIPLHYTIHDGCIFGAGWREERLEYSRSTYRLDLGVFLCFR